ncbi:MAG TPA: DUF4349 domain-containing protein [Dehalococcoidia bacterium]|nr:DUF4349 domain-containing protein [Dehalococcoidia bacterium]
MKTMRTTWLVAAAAIVLALTAACGADGASDEGGDDAVQGAPAGEFTSGERDGVAVAPDVAGSAGGAGGAAAPETGGGPPSGSLPPVLDRKIIMTATLTLAAEEVSQRFEDVANIAAGAGGFVASSSFGFRDDEQVASVTLRVPGTEYQRVLGELRKLGEVRSEQATSNDVTEQFTDLESRLRNLQRTEQQYLELLGRAQTVDEVLVVQDRLGQVRGEIEQVQGRIQLLEDQVDLATITVHLEPPAIAQEAADDGGLWSPGEAAERAWESSLAVLSGAVTVGVAVLVFSWWMVPLALAAAAFGRWQMRRRGA